MTHMDWIRQMEALSRQCRQGRGPSQDCRQCQAKSHGRLLELSVPTERCPHDRAGHCLMCNYGTGERVTDLHAFSTQVGELLHRHRPETLLLSTNGSVLDDACLPPAAQELLLAEAAASPARTVILETHPETLREEKLALVESCLAGKQVILEIGLESAREWVRTQCLLKPLSDQTVEHCLGLARRHAMAVQCNVLVGTPFLSLAEQLWDAEETIRWCLARGCMAAVFPVQIRPHTVLQLLYRQGLYLPPPRWALVWLLLRFSAEELQAVDLAQYDTDEWPQDGPLECGVCRQPLQRLLERYAAGQTDRRRLLTEFVARQAPRCGCWERLLAGLCSMSPPSRRRTAERQTQVLTALAELSIL